MKIILSLGLILMTSSLWAKKDTGEFNRAMMEEIKLEVKADAESFKKPSRSPASVGPSPVEKIHDHKRSVDKIEKNQNQLGKPRW
jgi:hypothetical protein